MCPEPVAPGYDYADVFEEVVCTRASITCFDCCSTFTYTRNKALSVAGGFTHFREPTVSDATPPIVLRISI